MKFSLVLLFSEISVWLDLLIPLDFRSKSTSLSKKNISVLFPANLEQKKIIKWIYSGKTCSPRTWSPTFVAIKGWSNSGCSSTTVRICSDVVTYLSCVALFSSEQPIDEPGQPHSQDFQYAMQDTSPSLRASLALCWAVQRTWTWKGATGAAMKKVSFNFERIFSEILRSPCLFFMRTSPVSIRKLS